MGYKLDKAGIEQLAKDVRKWASDNKLGKDWMLFYNGKLFDYPLVKGKDGHYVYGSGKEKQGVSPLDYSEWFSDKFIMGMSYDGLMYECINGYTKAKAYENLESLLSDYNLYLEHCDSCHCEFVWGGDSMSDVEYTAFEKEKVNWLYLPEDAPDDAIRLLMHEFERLCTEVGDKGACTIGEYIEFRRDGKLYRMCMQTPYQGEISWRKPLPTVLKMLEMAGVTDIHVNYGRLD